jgi:gliding motility-associated-like protein
MVTKYIKLLFFILCASVLKTHGQLGFCSGGSGDSIFTETFGEGTSNTGLPAGTTTYNYNNDYPLDGEYTVSNGSFENLYDWHQTEDHTLGDTNGKALIVNAEANSGEFYRTEITGLCQNTTYEFSAWLINLVKANSFCAGQPGGTIPINVGFEISIGGITASGDTGPIVETSTPNWNRYGLVFNTGNEISVVLRMINNGAGGCGNDLAIDDIVFKSCGDNATTVDAANNTSMALCSSQTPYPLHLTATPDGSVYNTPVYQWQESTNGTIWNNINGANAQTVNLSVTASRYYRAKIAEVATNLNNNQCISFSDEYQVTINAGPTIPVTACWEIATINQLTCNWNVTGVQPTKPTDLECWYDFQFNTTSCTWVNMGSQDPMPTGLECWQNATFNTTSCSWIITGSQPEQPNPATLECWENSTFNSTTCEWDVTGSQSVQPILECWQSANFNNTSCQWEVTGNQAAQPTLECWETATFNVTTCNWVVTGAQPTQPALECWQSANFNNTSCQWEVTGSQTIQPNIECWETATFNDTTCDWEVTGTQDVQPDPSSLECWEMYSFDDITCAWEVTGSQSIPPTLECWQAATFNNATCDWVVTGTQAVQPPLECWETATFNNTTCSWVVTGTQAVQPILECWETTTFNTTTCTWDVTGSQDVQPVLECWETATFNATSCTWEISGMQPVEPDSSTLACGETALFNSLTCVWEISGSPTEQPNIKCYETASFNSSTCTWDISGNQPDQPTTACWQSALFNETSCNWELSGIQPESPVLECGESTLFNATSCSWEVSGSATEQPDIACYETAVFNDLTCIWDITGSQPEQAVLACGETATFNTTSCTWEVLENLIAQPETACYETAIFNEATCLWDISGSQPEQPDLESWETATFDTASCSWSVSVTQTTSTTEESINLCEGSELVLSATTNLEMPNFNWNTGSTSQQITVNSSGIYTVDITEGAHALETTIYTITEVATPIIESVVSDGDEIIITTANSGDFMYSLDGVVFQDNPRFKSVEGGAYTIYVKSTGCDTTTRVDHLHFYVPKFFTPNNDGINDTFKLSGIQNYSTSQVAIYNRYGKLLRFSNNSSFEWDGTYKNENLPADDYWYHILIEDQKITGHVTLKR